MRTLLASDRESSIESIRRTFALDPTYEIVGEVFELGRLLAAIATLRPELVIVNLRLPNVEGWPLASLVARHYPLTRIVLLAACEDPVTSSETRAYGYVVTGVAPAPLASVISQAAVGI